MSHGDQMRQGDLQSDHNCPWTSTQLHILLVPSPEGNMAGDMFWEHVAICQSTSGKSNTRSQYWTDFNSLIWQPRHLSILWTLHIESLLKKEHLFIQNYVDIFKNWSNSELIFNLSDFQLGWSEQIWPSIIPGRFYICDMPSNPAFIQAGL